MTRPINLCAGQRQFVTPDMVEGVDYVCYEQVPPGPRDIVYGGDGRWVDRRTTDGEMLAADGRNAKAA